MYLNMFCIAKIAKSFQFQVSLREEKNDLNSMIKMSILCLLQW